MNPRLACIHVLQQVVTEGRNLPDALNTINSRLSEPDRALVQAICYGTIRFYSQLEFITRQLLQKPLKQKDQDILFLILTGLFQIRNMRIPDHAAVSETVSITKPLKKAWARGLVNAVLRNYLRQAEQLNHKIQHYDAAHYAHPQWWIDRVRQAWPEQWQSILNENNQPPPFSLRVNRQSSTAAEYQALLQQSDISARLHDKVACAVILDKPLDVNQLPGFSEGKVSVQDAAAQLAALLLEPQTAERVLDACAAPGGKTLHIFEQQPELQTLIALDSDAERLQRVEENRRRGHANIELLCGNAEQPSSWWDNKQFDRILLDAPCSASGVIRRHPDIKLLRHAEDLPALVKTQQEILTTLWPLLKEGGILLYVTCSIFPEENAEQIKTFLQQQKTARLIALEADWGHDTGFGQQLLPGEDRMDGFFYAKLQKLA